MSASQGWGDAVLAKYAKSAAKKLYIMQILAINVS